MKKKKLKKEELEKTENHKQRLETRRDDLQRQIDMKRRNAKVVQITGNDTTGFVRKENATAEADIEVISKIK